MKSGDLYTKCSDLLSQPSERKLIITHYPYDLDGLCSSLALANVLDTYSHEVKLYLFYPLPPKLNSILSKYVTESFNKLTIVDNDDSLTALEGALLETDMVIFMDKPSPQKIIVDSALHHTALYANYITHLKRFLRPDKTLIIDHRPAVREAQSYYKCIRPDMPANSMHVFLLIDSLISRYNGPSELNCEVFLALLIGILSDTVMLSSCEIDSTFMYYYQQLLRIIEKCGYKISILLEDLRSNIMDSLYYHFIDILSNRVYIHNMNPRLGISYVFVEDYKAAEVSSMNELYGTAGFIAKELLSRYGNLDYLLLISEDIENPELCHVIINARCGIDLSTIRQQLNAGGRSSYIRLTVSETIQNASDYIIRIMSKVRPIL